MVSAVLRDDKREMRPKYPMLHLKAWPNSACVLTAQRAAQPCLNQPDSGAEQPMHQPPQPHIGRILVKAPVPELVHLDHR